MMFRLLAAIAASLLVFSPVSRATATPPSQVLLSYEVTLNADIPDVTNIIIFNNYLNGSGSTWAFTAFGGQTTTLADPFPKDNLNNPPLQGLLLGLTKDLPNDPPGQEHVVLFMNDLAAANATHIAWGTLFPGTSESQLIGAIRDYTAGLPFEKPVMQAASASLGAFIGGDAQNGNLGINGEPGSAFFEIGGTFTVMAWSEGTVIGTGTSMSVAAVPEPQTYALMLIGLVLTAAGARRMAGARSAS